MRYTVFLIKNLITSSLQKEVKASNFLDIHNQGNVSQIIIYYKNKSTGKQNFIFKCDKTLGLPLLLKGA